MDVYIISLNKSEELVKEISNFKLNPILVKGVNGKELTSNEINENTSYLYPYIGPRSAIGIGMSHINVWKMFLESGKPNCLIVEDDALFEDNFVEKLNIGLENTPKDYDILYLGCFGCQSQYNYHTLMHRQFNFKKINDYVSVPGIAFATHGYIVSKRGVKKLLKYLDKNIYMHIDGCIQDLHKSNLIKEYVLNERIIYQSSTDSSVSTNTSNTHPYIVSKLLSNFYLDTKLRANYDLSMSQMQIGSFVGTPSTLIFLLLGIIVYCYKVNIINLTGIYLVVNIPDILYTKNELPIIVHYFLLILPTLIMNNKNKI
jgi:GR25 family glycosyltransferase involved in LPS biosynthesis